MKTVLIVDDVPDSTQPLAVLLGMSGYRTALAENGVEALGFMRVLAPDAIVLDLIMPVMDGFDFLENVRSHGRWSNLPVLAYSAMLDPHAEQRLQRLGVARCLRKAEVSFEGVIDSLQQVLGDTSSTPGNNPSDNPPAQPGA